MKNMRFSCITASPQENNHLPLFDERHNFSVGILGFIPRGGCLKIAGAGQLKKEFAKTQGGFSLLETLLASSLGLLTLSLLLVIYLGLKMTFESNKDLSTIQQNGRFIIHYFNEILKNAGLNTCPHLGDPTRFEPVSGKYLNHLHDSIVVYQCFWLNGLNRFLPIEYFLENGKLYLKPKSGFHPRRVLVNGVEAMKISYGVGCKEEQGVCDYVSSTGVNHWKNVKSVSMELVLVSRQLKKKWHLYVALPKPPPSLKQGS